MLRPRVHAPILVLLAAACSSMHDDVSRAFLDPAPEWLVEPAALGLDAEWFDLAVDGATLTGFFVRAPSAAGRTVLLFHGNHTNASQVHPYYTFLVAAGLNVCVFDYRGFGRSKGTPSLRGLVYDMPVLLDWLQRRGDVDAGKIAYYGVSIGSIAALHAAAHHRACRALVLENVPSPRDGIRTRIESRGQAATTLAAGFAEFASMPEDIEPSDNAAQLSMPSLWIGGTDEPKDELRATLRAWYEMRGDKQLWILPDTGPAPHSLLTFDGEYQRVVATFLRTALDGAPERVAASWRPVGANPGGAGTWEIALQRQGPGKAEPWAVQVCALDARATPTWSRTWLDGDAGTVRVELPGEPGAVSAMRVGDAERTPTGAFARAGTPLSRGGKWYEEHLAAFDKLRNEQVPLTDVKAIAATIRARDEIEKLPPLLEAQLADVFAITGTALAANPDAEDKAQGIVWLRRAVAAAPDHPERHYWPGHPASAGFPQQHAVEAARDLLKKLAQ
jgi:fermentation-respiration switch protein FrsA (DUF1100 family)